MRRLAVLLLIVFCLHTHTHTHTHAHADVRGAAKNIILLLPSPLMEIDGENAKAIESFLSFMEQRHCSEAAGGVVIVVTGYARDNASDVELSAARVRSYKVRSYLAERSPKYALIYSESPRLPEKQYNKWDEFAPRSALPGAVLIGVFCSGI